MTDDAADAVAPARGGGFVLQVQVVPGARSARFPAGYDPWRRAVEARVRALPEKGEANAELVRLVAAFFGVPAADVAVTAGATSRRKTVTVRRGDPEEARRRLRARPKP